MSTQSKNTNEQAEQLRSNFNPLTVSKPLNQNNALGVSEEDAEELRQWIIEDMSLDSNTELPAAITLFFMVNSHVSNKYSDFIRHYNNRKINKNHVKTLRAILNDNASLQIWYPILVIENRLGLTQDDMDDIRKAIDKGQPINHDEYQKKDRTGVYIPKYIIVDGQHRFQSFKEEKRQIVYCDLTNLYGNKVNDPEFVKQLVDKFNIGVKGFSKKETRTKRIKLNSFLNKVNEEASKLNIRIHKDKNMRKERVNHTTMGYTTQPFSNVISTSWVEKSLGSVAAEHSSSSYMSKKKLTKDDEVKIRKSIQYSKCFIEGIDGHFPPMTTEAYAWVHHMTNHIHNTSIDVQIYQKLSDHLINVRNFALNNVPLQTKNDLKFAVTELYTKNSVIKDFLDKNYKYKTLKSNVNKNGFDSYEIESILPSGNTQTPVNSKKKGSK